MGCVIYLLNYIVPSFDSLILTLLKLLVFALVGASIYFVLIYKNKGLEMAFGKEQIESIMKRVHLKK